ncbi:MAG TPA: AbrB family transcriptional regulator [Patescibacteria group bacterium]|nr:AbrB family transcriptional regulator [Patescibacteria group bacterium]
MVQQTISIGNSIGVIIPKNVLKEKNIKLGDPVEIDIKPVKIDMQGVDVQFMKMIDEFIEDHKDVLQKLANR